MSIKKFQPYLPKNIAVTFSDNTAIFEVSASDIKTVTTKLYHDQALPLKLLTASDERQEHGCFKIWYIFGVPKENIFVIPFIKLTNTQEFPSLTPVIHEAADYERKIQTFFGLTPVGHPDARPIILHQHWPKNIWPLRKDFHWQTPVAAVPGEYQFHQVAGEGIYEIPVGPIHAGIIEPGHFRFSVAGEEIVLLEPQLGFTHKGTEKLFEVIPLANKVRLAEKVSGDSSFSHSLAFCQTVEQLNGSVPPRRARYLRVLYAELERLANHFGDIGAIMLDTGSNFGGAQGARLRELVIQLNERLTGSRFLRGVNVLGGVTKDITTEDATALLKDLAKITKDFSEVIEIAEGSVSLLNRLKGTGVLSLEVAKDRGVVGVAARAVGLHIDTRIDFPYAAYDELPPNNIPTEHGGDVYARFCIRVQEVYTSTKNIQRVLEELPSGPISLATTTWTLKKNAVAISLVEGWRGEIIYFLITDADGTISRVALRDPSFLNWSVLGDVGFGNVVPEFPLINKSFNLSYSGNDL